MNIFIWFVGLFLIPSLCQSWGLSEYASQLVFEVFLFGFPCLVLIEAALRDTAATAPPDDATKAIPEPPSHQHQKR